MNKKTILITGGAGYIGSHAVVAFEQSGFNTVIVDNLSNSTTSSLDSIEKILGYRPSFHEGDIRDEGFLLSVFGKYHFDGVIHFAGKKFVTESLQNPIGYFENNVNGVLVLLKVMEKYGVQNMVFSSTAGVYDSNNQVPPFGENTPKKVVHPYASSKLITENILEQLSLTGKLKSLSLRYFNVMGAHESGLLGDNYFSNETNVVGYLYRTVLKKQSSFFIYGNNFDTKDGTAIRDYIDVWDLVQAHINGYEYISRKAEFIADAINIGNGVGTTVQELQRMVSNVTGIEFPVEVKEPRFGDVGVSISLPEKAFDLLGWQPKVSLEESIKRGWGYVMNTQKNR